MDCGGEVELIFSLHVTVILGFDRLILEAHLVNRVRNMFHLPTRIHSELRPRTCSVHKISKYFRYGSWFLFCTFLVFKEVGPL